MRTRSRLGRSVQIGQLHRDQRLLTSSTDVVRDSPALAVAQKLHELGAAVTVTDPRPSATPARRILIFDYIDDPIAAVQDADLLLHLTE
ncbi:UDP binding domain-containing protein [Streptomyces sp. NPDC017988]|uniref:UDP binding domain-containing protein n=1 Tax=Streptomyces sp. NPDC017988 TaxID=3365025 RepID=UPI0037AC98E6